MNMSMRMNMRMNINRSGILTCLPLLLTLTLPACTTTEIDEFRQSKDKVIAQKQQMTFSAEKEKARLDAIETKVNQLFMRACELTYNRQLTLKEFQKLTEGKSLVIS